MTAAGSSFEPPCLALIEPPMPCNDKDDIEQVESYHGHSLPQVQLAVDDEAHAESGSNNEEAHVTDEALARDIEGADQGHRSRDYGSNEAGGANEFADGQTCSMCAEGSKGGKDVWTAIAERKQGHTGQALAHAQHACDGVQIDAEEVAGGNADGAEEQGEPEGHHDECDRFGMGQATVVKCQVGYNAGFLVGAVGQDEGALVGGMVDETALRIRSVVAVCGCVCCPTSSSSMLTSLLRTMSLPGVSPCRALAHASRVISVMARMVSAKGRAEYFGRRHRCTVSRMERSFIVITFCFMRAGV